MTGPHELAQQIDAGLRAAARPERAAGEKAYLKSTLEHYGTSMPAIRSAVRTAIGRDGLAASVVGPLVEREPSLGATLDRWAADEDFWIRRSALLALLLALRRGEGDFDRFGRYADSMLGEKEFFVRKAIGWVLRDTGRKRPDLVYAWLLPRAARASGVTVREAVKPLSDEQRAAVQALRTRTDVPPVAGPGM